MDDQTDDAADDEQCLFESVIRIFCIEEIVEFQMFLGDPEHGPLQQLTGKLIPVQDIQQSTVLFPEGKITFQHFYRIVFGDGFVVVDLVGIQNKVVDETMEASFPAAEIAVKGLPGQACFFADTAHGDLLVGDSLHHIQQTVFDLPLAADAFFRVAAPVYGKSLQ